MPHISVLEYLQRNFDTNIIMKDEVMCVINKSFSYNICLHDAVVIPPNRNWHNEILCFYMLPNLGCT